MEFFRKFVAWFVAGIGLASGVAAVAWPVSALESKPHPSPTTQALPTSEVVLSEVTPISVTEHVAYAATLLSKSHPGVSVQLEASVSDAGKLLYQCPAQAFSLRTHGTPERVQYECRGVAKSRLPLGAAVELSVKRVTKLPA